jgi:putative membrane protein
MDRRIVLAGLAAAITAPALAQTRSIRPPAQAGSASVGSATSQAGGMGQPGQAEMQHMHETMRLGILALETSQVAQQRAQNPDLKRFAGFEVQEQTTLSEVLRSMMEPATTAATAGTKPSTDPGAAAQTRELMQRHQDAQPGEAFDRVYLQGQLEGHRALLQTQDQYLQSNPQNREHLNVAKLARNQILEHIALLEDIQQKMR